LAKTSEASPGKTPEGMDMWHARYRRGSAKGVFWRLVNDANKQPMCYAGVTEALNAATFACESDRSAHR
jgi:hypothetical protein